MRPQANEVLRGRGARGRLPLPLLVSLCLWMASGAGRDAARAALLDELQRGDVAVARRMLVSEREHRRCHPWAVGTLLALLSPSCSWREETSLRVPFGEAVEARPRADFTRSRPAAACAIRHLWPDPRAPGC